MGDVEAFLSGPHTRSPHLYRGGSFDDLLSIASVDDQLTGAGLRRPAVRVVRDGELIDPARWTRRARTGAVRIDDLVDPGRVLDLHAEGATVVLQSLQRWWPPLASFCRDIEQVLGHPVQANAYLTPPRAAGLTPHHDTHDVFVVQLHGTKRWTVREPLVVDPLARHRSDHVAAAEQPELFRRELQPGDCMYLPRGVIHSAETQQGTSLHLTVGVLARTVHDVLQRLVDRAADEPAFRRTLAPSPDATERRGELKRIVEELTGWLTALGDGLDDDELSTLLRTAPRRAPLLQGQLLELAALDGIDDRRVLVRRAGPLGMRRVGDRLELDLGDRTLELPATLEVPLGLLLDGGAHAVGELEGYMDGPSRQVLARRLVREGVLRSVDGT